MRVAAPRLPHTFPWRGAQLSVQTTLHSRHTIHIVALYPMKGLSQEVYISRRPFIFLDSTLIGTCDASASEVRTGTA
jgi:hypothetical protein